MDNFSRSKSLSPLTPMEPGDKDLVNWFRLLVQRTSTNPLAATIIAMVGDNYMAYKDYFPKAPNKIAFRTEMLKFCGLAMYDSFSEQIYTRRKNKAVFNLM